MVERVRNPLISVLRVVVALSLAFFLVIGVGTALWPSIDPVVWGIVSTVGAVILLVVTRRAA